MNETKKYQDSSLPVAARIEDLLQRMTLPEKVGQLLQLDGRAGYLEPLQKMHAGSLLHINGRDADEAIKASLKSRLGIPVLLADDGIHGHSFWSGAAIFPTQLALACSWDTELMTQVARVTAAEMRVTGLKWTFSPVLCLARDLRWGRVNETFGEDPFLVGEFACAMIKGYQGKGLGDPAAVLATAKHFAGYSETLGGRDASEAEISRRKLRSTFLPPFERAAREGCLSFMTGYQSIDGIPSTANRWLLTEVLKQEWGFEGILVTDWNTVGTLVTDQQICADYAEASAVAVKAGHDLVMATPEFFDGCQEAVRRGLLTIEEVDATVRRVLGLKFRMGLFENPGRGDPAMVSVVINNPEHQEINLRAARESLVLLKNEKVGESHLLPFDTSVPRKLAVLGPNADDPLAQLGDWSLGSGQMTGPSGAIHPRSTITTVLDGVKTLLPRDWRLTGVNEADFLILVLGDNVQAIGESKSTATLELLNGQKELAERALALGKPTVIVLINSKPLVLPSAVLEAQAIFEAFNPGMKGGQALAEALFGTLNPSGKLTISFPFHVGQQPVYYNQVRGQHGKTYADLTQEPAFSFGFGLGYTSFKHSEPRLAASNLNREDRLRVETTVINTGDREGVEVVQLYIEDLVTSATWAKRELKAYKRLRLAAGETQRVQFEIPVSELWILDGEGKRVVESGAFRVLTGASSRDQDLKAAEFRVS